MGSNKIQWAFSLFAATQGANITFIEMDFTQKYCINWHIYDNPSTPKADSVWELDGLQGIYHGWSERVKTCD